MLPLSETGRDLSLHVAGAARVQIKQLKPKPYTVDRTEALPLIERLLQSAPELEVVWLSDGIDLGKGGEFIAGLKRVLGSHPLTVVAGGVPAAHALAAADNAAGALTVKVLARANRRRRRRLRQRASTSKACRSARRRSPSSPARAKPRR